MKTRSVLGLGLVAAGLSFVAAWSGCTPTVREITGTGGGGSGASGTGGAGTGGSGMCKAGDMVECYDGPAGTQGVGQCQVGKAACGPDGKPGTCEGEVLPAAKVDCAAHQDQDCDGVADRCPLDLIWGKAYGVAGGSGFELPSLAVDPKGDIVFAGYMTGQLDFGITTLATASGDADAFVSKIGADGTTVWARKFGDATNDQLVKEAKVDGSGNIFLAGSFHGALDGLGILVPPSAGSDDAFLVKLDPSGNALWVRSGGDSSSQSADALALTAEGDAIIAGRFYGSFSFNGGGGTLANATQNGSVVYIQRFDKDGTATWNAVFSSDATAGSSYQSVYSAAVDINGDVLVTGYFSGTAVFPDGSARTAQGSDDVFVIKLHGTDGQTLWVRTYGSLGSEEGYGIATDSQGNVFAAGRFEDSMVVDGQTLVPQDGNHVGLYLLKLTPAGNLSWAKAYGCGMNTGGAFVQIGENNTVLLVGAFDTKVDFGGGALAATFSPTQSLAAGFIAKLDNDGNHLASKAFNPIVPADVDGGTQFGSVVLTYRIAATPGTHEIVAAGLAVGEFDLGGGTIGKPTVGGPFLGKFSP